MRSSRFQAARVSELESQVEKSRSEVEVITEKYHRLEARNRDLEQQLNELEASLRDASMPKTKEELARMKLQVSCSAPQFLTNCKLLRASIAIFR